MIVSHNRRHFERLHFDRMRAGQSHPGILIVPESLDPDQLSIRVALLAWIDTLPSGRSTVLRWGDLQYRITQGYRLPGFSNADVRLALGQT